MRQGEDIAARYRLRRSTGIQFDFDLVSAENVPLLTSQLYATKGDAENGIRSVRLHSPFDANYIRKVSSPSQFFFILIATNGETLGRGEMHTTAHSRDHSIGAVKSAGRAATVVNQT